MAVGEIKGEGSGLYQVLAAMQAHRQSQGVWPVGFIVDQDLLQLLEAQQRKDRVTVTITKFNLADLDQVLGFIEQLCLSTNFHVWTNLAWGNQCWIGCSEWSRKCKT